MASKSDQLMVQHLRQSQRAAQIMLCHLSFHEPQDRVSDLEGIVESIDIVGSDDVRLPAFLTVHDGRSAR